MMYSMAPIHYFLLLSCFIGINEGGKKVIKEKVRPPQHSSNAGKEDVDIVHYTLEIQHAFGKDGTFSTRGIVQIKHFKPSQSVLFEQEQLSPPKLKLLKQAALENDYYFVRARTNFSEGTLEGEGRHDNMVMTLVSACAMIKSELHDIMIIHGSGQGNVISLTILPAKPVLNTGLHCTEEDISTITNMPFITSVSYTTGHNGPSPQIQAFLQKQEAEKAKKETEDNRSFFQKYWLYIVIGFVALQFLGGGLGGGGQ